MSNRNSPSKEEECDKGTKECEEKAEASKVDKEASTSSSPPDDDNAARSDNKAAGSSTEESSKSSKPSPAVDRDLLAGLMNQIRNLSVKTDDVKRKPKVLNEVSLKGVADYIKSGKATNIIVMTGAGISTSAGIPDFRSPGSGLYHNLQKYDLPHPQAIFELGFFMENPKPFFTLAKELWPGKYAPTPSHYFVKLLAEKNVLLRTFTQNIDTLERVAEIPAEHIIEAHGTFFNSHCVACRKHYTLDWMRVKIFADETPRCETEDCGGVVKPDIVFFGENLPRKFFTCMKNDFPVCDLLIVMGTELVVQPFASLITQVPQDCPRLLINRNVVGEASQVERMYGFDGFDFESEDNSRDVFWKGNCDEGAKELAKLLGWKDDLNKLMESKRTIDDSAASAKQEESSSNNKS